MRFAEPMSRVLAVGLAFTGAGATPAVSGTHPGAPLALEARVFFPRFAARDGLLPDIRGLLLSGVDERRARTVIAALAATNGAMRDHGGVAAWGGAGSLPAVPKPLTEPSPPIDALEKRMRSPDIPLLRVEQPWLSPLPAHPRLCAICVGRKKMSWLPDHPAMSRFPSIKQISSHRGDPLAALELDDESSDMAKAPAFIMPFANGRVTSLFNQGRRHPAIDLAGALGSPVLATTPGQTVVFAGRRGGYGNAAITRDGYGRTHLYGHLRSITSRVGQLLQQGEKLGHLGSTGHSTGPHVHYEVRTSKGQHINAVTLLFPDRRVAVGYAWRDVRPTSMPAVALAKVAR